MDEISPKLTTIFQNVNDWLKFAEAKNAVLLVFSSSGVTAIVTLVTANPKLSSLSTISLLIATFLLCISSLICALSFLPKTDINRFLWVIDNSSKKLTSQGRDNLYYFGDLQKYNPTELLDAFNKFYLKNRLKTPYDKEWNDLAAQIIINSKITITKLRLFAFSLYLLITSIGFILTALIIAII